MNRYYPSRETAQYGLKMTAVNAVMGYMCTIAILIISLKQITYYQYYMDACQPQALTVLVVPNFLNFTDFTASNGQISCRPFLYKRIYPENTVITGYYVRDEEAYAACFDTYSDCIYLRDQEYSIWPWILLLCAMIFTFIDASIQVFRLYLLKQHIKQFENHVIRLPSVTELA
jgi:hypothetical protein